MSLPPGGRPGELAPMSGARLAKPEPRCRTCVGGAQISPERSSSARRKEIQLASKLQIKRLIFSSPPPAPEDSARLVNSGRFYLRLSFETPPLFTDFFGGGALLSVHSAKGRSLSSSLICRLSGPGQTNHLLCPGSELLLLMFDLSGFLPEARSVFSPLRKRVTLFCFFSSQLDNVDEQAAQIRRELDGRLQLADKISRVRTTRTIETFTSGCVINQ